MLSSMLRKAIDQKCSHIVIMPQHRLINFLCIKGNLDYQIEIVANENEKATVYQFDPKLIIDTVSVLKSLEEQPILLIFDKADYCKLSIRLVSQIIDQTWRFQN